MDTNTQIKPVETPPAAKAKKPIYKRLVGDRAGRHLRDRRHLAGGRWR